MNNAEWSYWETLFENFLSDSIAHADASHDLSHIQRVVKMAKYLAHTENACLDVVVPAAWLHDCVLVSKDSPQRSQASRLAADAAVAFLQQCAYPACHLDAIAHAIEAHSFSANIPPRTCEAMVVQDADRLDALGAIGIIRAFVSGAQFQRSLPLYASSDPFAKHREASDSISTLDHFYVKLFNIVDTLHTETARQEGQHRKQFMLTFLSQLATEIPIIVEHSDEIPDHPQLVQDKAQWLREYSSTPLLRYYLR